MVEEKEEEEAVEKGQALAMGLVAAQATVLVVGKVVAKEAVAAEAVAEEEEAVKVMALDQEAGQATEAAAAAARVGMEEEEEGEAARVEAVEAEEVMVAGQVMGRATALDTGEGKVIARHERRDYLFFCIMK